MMQINMKNSRGKNVVIVTAMKRKKAISIIVTERNGELELRAQTLDEDLHIGVVRRSDAGELRLFNEVFQ